MAKPVSFYGETINDNTLNTRTGKPESASFAVAGVAMTPGNAAAQVTLTIALSAAIADITIGIQAKKDVTYLRQIVSTARASSVLAQRENKWLCRYSGNSTHDSFVASIPTADLSLLPDGSEFLDLADAGVGQAFKDAFEDYVVSPNDSSESVTLNSVQFVGRNS